MRVGPVGSAAAAAAVAVSVVGEEAQSAAGGALDEEALPCDWVEKVAGAWNCAKLGPDQPPPEKQKHAVNENSFRVCNISSSARTISITCTSFIQGFV